GDFLGQALITRNANPGNVDPHVWPDYTLTVHDNVWQTVANIEFTNENLNHINAAGGAVIGGGAGAGLPYVIPARLCHAFAKMRRDLPQQQRARREIKFVNLIQGDLPIRDFYEQVRHSGQLLGFGREVIAHQFYRGLNEENTLEAQRSRDDRDVEQLVDNLERLERTKAEMGALSRRKTSYYLDPPKETKTPQEPVTLQTSADVEQLLKQQADVFQKQIRDLQKSIQQRPIQQRPIQRPIVRKSPGKPIQPNPPRRVVRDHQDPDYDDGYEEHDVGFDPGAPEWTLEDHQNAIDLIMGYKRGTSRILTNQLQKAKDRRDDQELARAMRNLDLNDDAMDIDNNVASFEDLKFVPDEEGGFRICVVRSAKKKKLLREILQEEISSVRKVVEIPEDLAEEKQEEDIREDDPMDIDITRLENTKDLLALGGEVNGISIQCLADTCANASFIQRETAEELGLVIDKSITHNISGAPGSGRTFGMVKGVSIKLTPDCVITEDLAVLDGYKHREIGLSRTCLKRYNYDVHESREHVALTCDGKNVFIPIVPDVNRGDKK
ncbi:hypothetical protein RhiirA4_487365, partial [Rhizophagus irregularis]